jgi:hypothetical protein
MKTDSVKKDLAPTPVKKGDLVLTTNGKVETVSRVKHNNMQTGQYAILSGKPTSFAPAGQALPTLSWEGSGDSYVASALGVSCTLKRFKVPYNGSSWTCVVSAAGHELSEWGRTMEQAKLRAPALVVIVAWHAAGNTWDLPAEGVTV